MLKWNHVESINLAPSTLAEAARMDCTPSKELMTWIETERMRRERLERMRIQRRHTETVVGAGLD